MKMIKTHYDHMKQAIDKVLNNNPNAYEGYVEKSLSNMRFRWDIMHAANLTSYACNHLYGYLNDGHIDTALRKITNTD